MNTSNYLVFLLKKHLNGESIVLDNGTDFVKLAKLAEFHNLSAVLYCILNNAENKEIIDKSVLNGLENDFFKCLYNFELQKEVKNDISQVLSHAKVRHIFFKGTQTAKYYPVPESRKMGDIDFLIDFDNAQSAKDALTENGYACKEYGGNVWTFAKNGVLAEMHLILIEKGEINESSYCFFKNAVNVGLYDGFSGTFDNEYHLAYLIAHIAHHFKFGGAGIRHILDIASYVKNSNLNFEKVYRYLEETELKTFSTVIFSICDKWFGTNLIIGEKPNTEKCENYILKSGTFGTDSQKAVSLTRRSVTEYNKKIGLAIRLKLLFPSYEKMVSLPYMGFLKNKKYLLLFAWFYRAFYILFKRKNNAFKSIANIGSKDTLKKADEENNFFEEIGLQ
ncbi:MAG: hypothetical protein DBY14_01030 [Escherichia coli]|nr:MAG: hypothetical protein DBY14_01030 [Escherichia coli]